MLGSTSVPGGAGVVIRRTCDRRGRADRRESLRRERLGTEPYVPLQHQRQANRESLLAAWAYRVKVTVGP